MSKKALEHTEPWHKANYFSDKLYFMGSVKVNNTQGDGDKCRGVTNFAACFTNIPWGLTWEGPKQTDQKLHRAKQHLGPAVCIRASFRFVDPPPPFFYIFLCFRLFATFCFLQFCFHFWPCVRWSCSWPLISRQACKTSQALTTSGVPSVTSLREDQHVCEERSGLVFVLAVS